MHYVLSLYPICRSYIVDLQNPRTKDWFLVAKPYQCLTILCVYLLFVFKWGPKFMKNRQPYNIDRIMILHNAIQIYCCGHLFINGVTKWISQYRLFCEPVDYSESENAVAIAKLVYYYYLLKILDLTDTIFFILRKKFNQASFLHVYHHGGMIILGWCAVTYFPGGHGTSLGLINSFVHVVMYSYYLLSVAVPKIKESIRLKKLITQIQIIQFFLLVVHIGAIVFIPDCGYPRWTAAAFLPQNLFMLVLFVDFYIKTYIKKPKQTTCLESDKKSEEESHLNEDKNNVRSKETNEIVHHIIKRNAVLTRN